MSDETVLWRSGATTVTDERVRTPRVTVSLADIDLVELRRPLLGGAVAFAIATTALGLRFVDVLLARELLALVGTGWFGVALGLLIARVRLHSYSIDGIAITLPIWQARSLRSAIDTAIAHRRPRTYRRRSTT